MLAKLELQQDLQTRNNKELKPNGITEIKQDGKLLTDPLQKAGALNAQFQSVFTPASNISHTEFVKQCNMPQNTPFPPISKLIIKTEGIQKLLHNLNPNKAAGPDEIKPRFLKELSHEIAPILTIIFEKSIKTGVVPDDWKTAHVSPQSQTGSSSRGGKSEYVAVESGVPQGSVLGPSLFLYYINDIPTGLTSTARLFADDTIVYLAIKSNSDALTLQKDLDKLASWETTWKMAFHPDKCNVISVTRNKKPITFNYTLHNHSLEHVTTAKYLGVTISSNLKWDVHINNICKKANSTLGFLRRNLNISSTSIKEQAYKSLVRPSLEYACSVWDPYLQQDIDSIEKVQRRAARFVTNKYRNTSSVGSMLQHLEWRSLSDRRKDSRLVMLYKIEHEKVAIPKNNKLIPQKRQTRHSNSNSFQIPSCKTQYRKESYLPRTITDWNKLPDNIVNCTSVDSFKSSISKHQY
ncbi:uncharacterized protein [Mytilus edulis]|uniref:uncharacterized protein n=1 Tax=Mytilus edulis TaxID=6550 RepID=UPI0039F14E32